MLTPRQILHIPDNLYVDYEVPKVMTAYAPRNTLENKNPIAVLNEKAKYVFSLIDGKKSVREIKKQTLLAYPSTKKSEIHNILKEFLQRNIVKKKPRKFDPNPKMIKVPDMLTVRLHLTNSCNLRCSYCYIHKNAEKMQQKTMDIVIQKIFATLLKHGVKTLSIKFAGGEPLMELDLLLYSMKKIKETAQKHNIAYKFVIISNATILSSDILNKFNNEEVSFAISCDGDKKDHDAQRMYANGTGSFDDVMKGIQLLQRYDFRFNIIITLTTQNIKNLPSFIKYVLEQNIPFTFNFVREFCQTAISYTNINEEFVAFLKETYDAIALNPPEKPLVHQCLDLVQLQQLRNVNCGMGWNYLAIDHHGQIALCPIDMENKIGHILRDDLIECIQEYNQKHQINMPVDQRGECSTCQWKYLCGGGCPLLSKNINGNSLTPSPYCQTYKKLIPEVLRLEAKRVLYYRQKYEE